MYFIFILTAILLMASLFKDYQRTKEALYIALKKFSKILPSFLVMVILSSIVLFMLPEHVITFLLNNDNKLFSLSFASSLGSILILPGFIAFPLSGILLQEGVTYMVISAFTTTLMMVGILTFPVEKQYFGTKSTILRNVFSFCIAIVVAFITGLLFNEIL